MCPKSDKTEIVETVIEPKPSKIETPILPDPINIMNQSKTVKSENSNGELKDLVKSFNDTVEKFNSTLEKLLNSKPEPVKAETIIIDSVKEKPVKSPFNDSFKALNEFLGV
jgi:hypothetical protein